MMEDPVIPHQQQPPAAPHIQEPQIVNRLASLPLVLSTYDQLTALYTQTKEAHKLLRYTLETSESCLKTVANTAMPYVHTFDKPISALDSIACDGLDKLQERYPIIKAPSEQVYQKTVKPAVDYGFDKMDTATDKVNTMKDCGVKQVEAANEAVQKAKEYTVGQICCARDQGLEKVENIRSYTNTTWEGVKDYSTAKYDSAKSYGTDTVRAALDTPYGHVVSDQLERSLEWSEKFIDQYLPQVEELGENKADDTEDPPESSSQLDRAVSLTNKTKQRLCHHAMINLKLMQVRTQETIDKYNFTNDLVAYAKTNLAILSSMLSLKLNNLWRELNQSDAEVAAQAVAQGSATSGLEDRLIATARHVMHTCKRGMSAASYGLQVVPGFISQQFDKLKTYTQDLQELIRVAGGLSEIRTFLLEQAQAKLAGYEDHKFVQTARTMMLVGLEKVSIIQERFKDTKDYVIRTPFVNWMGFKSKEEEDGLEMDTLERNHEKSE